MATEGKKITVDVRKKMGFPFRICYRFAQDHPFLLGMVFFLYILYSYCPALFAFLVSFSPVLVCTTLLLGILLVYGEPNICETEEDKRKDISSLKGSVNVNDDGFCTAHKLIDNSDAGSSGSSQDIESEDENQEDEEARERDDTIEAVVTWTADDQKNLVDLGTSEIERNQRLEKLIVKRRARKFLSFHVEKNLIDLDSNDPMANTDELYRSQCQIPSISAPRHNPFDLPFDAAEETAGLPPIPCSAPSILQPRRNPFDFPLQQFEDSVNLHLFPQRMLSEGIDLANLPRQSTEKSDSKASSAHESDTNSSVVDQDHHEELLEEFHMESHVLLSENHYAEPVEQGSQSSEEVDAEHEDVDGDQAADAFGAVEMEIRQGDFHSTDPQAENLEVIEERYDDSSSSSSSETSEKNASMSIDGNSVNLEQTRNDAKEESGFVSVSKSIDEGFSSTTELWVAPPSLATVDDIESIAEEPSEIRERDNGWNKNVSVEVDATLINAAASSDSSAERAAVKDSDIGTSDASLIPKSRLKDFRVGSASSSGLSGLQLIAKVSRDKLEGKASNSSGKSTLGKVRNGVLVKLI